MYLACIPVDIEGGSSLIGLRKVSDKTVRIAELSFKILLVVIDSYVHI